MKIVNLPSLTSNFQTGYFPESIAKELCKETKIEKYVAITLKLQSRRILVRCSLLGLPADVPEVIRCDLRVQQILRKSRNWNAKTDDNSKSDKQKVGFSFISIQEGKDLSDESCTSPENELEAASNKEKEAEGMKGGSKCGSSDTSTATADGNSNQDEYDDDVDRMSHEDNRKWVLSRSRNDYSEIDLAHHVVEMEHMMMMSRGGGDAVTPNSGGLAAAAFAGEGKCLSLEQLPSTVRFNDAVACTSKDIQILKSGAIKMMRLTVICHSDLHYQSHQASSFESCFSNRITTAKETVHFTNSSATTKIYSSTKEKESTTKREWNDGRYEHAESHITTKTFDREMEKSENISKCLSSTTSTHHHSNHEHEHQFISAEEQREVVMKPSLSSTTTSKKWECLKEKIRSVFQAYNIQVGEGTIVSLKGCPLASFRSTFSPAVCFVFVEECKMKESFQSQHIELGRVTGKTEILITNVHHISHYHRLLEKSRSKELCLYGLENASKILLSVIEKQPGKEQLKESVATTCSSVNVSSNGLTEFSHGLLISGPSGCGKVAVVREIAKKVGAHLLSLNPVGSVEINVSQFCQQLTKIFMSALMTASRYPTVLLFPRIHLLFQRSNSPSSTKTFPSGSLQNRRERVLHHLCKLFDSIPTGLALSVVGTTDKAFLVPLQLRRAGRLEKEILISPPKLSDRMKIIQAICRDLPQFQNVNLEEVASQTPGYVAQDLHKLIRLALFKCQEEDCSNVSDHHIRYSIDRIVPSVLEGALGVVDIQRAISLDHIAGLHSVKLDLVKAIVWPLKHPHSFLRMGISPPKGILLYGPPGNCKTTLVRAIAASHQTNFLSVSAAELFSSGVGDSEKIVTHLFHRARMASPCILFIDELEAIVGSRNNSEKKQTSTNESILSMLLTEMDGVGTSKIETFSTAAAELTTSISHEMSHGEIPSLGPLVLVVAATNRPDLIDPALLRPGRFDKLIPVPPLDQTGRKELLEFCAKSIPFHSDVNFSDVAESTEFFSGADLVNLCKEAAIIALSEDMSIQCVTNQHLSLALSSISPSLNSEMLRAFYEYELQSVI